MSSGHFQYNNEKILMFHFSIQSLTNFFFLSNNDWNKKKEKENSSHYHPYRPTMVSLNKNSHVYVIDNFPATTSLLFDYDTDVISSVLTVLDFLLVCGGITSINCGSLKSFVLSSIVNIMLLIVSLRHFLQIHQMIVFHEDIRLFYYKYWFTKEYIQFICIIFISFNCYWDYFKICKSFFIDRIDVSREALLILVSIYQSEIVL